MRIVDPHVHLWDTRQVGYRWLEDPVVAFSGDNRLLPQCHDVTTFLGNAGSIEILKSVNVEANPADPLAEAQWLQSLAENPDNQGHPHGIVAGTDLARPDAPQLLERLSACRNMRGIRQILNVHNDSRYDYVGRHFLREPAWRKNLSELTRFGWSFDLQIYPAQVPDALETIRANPNLAFVVNHAGMFVDRNRAEGWRQWRDGLEALAACENVAVKVSGLVMFDHRWTTESLRPYVLEAIAAFGVERSMFASNFPIDGLHASYADLWAAYSDIVSGASASEREQLFAGSAMRWYRL